MPDYIKYWPHDCAFSPLRGNQKIDPLQVYLVSHVTDDIAFCPYCCHHEMHKMASIHYTPDGWLTGQL